MFESINREDRRNPLRSLSSFLISLCVHGTILGVIVALPLLFCNALQPGESVFFILDPPALPVLPPLPAPPAAGSASPGEGATDRTIDYAPAAIPGEILSRAVEVPHEGGPAPFGWERGITGPGIVVQEAGDRSAIADYVSSLKPKELPLPARPAKPAPIPVVGSLQASKIIYKVSPVYPDLARATRTSGTVELEAIIDEEGNVSDLAVVSGHPLLVDAAKEAVRQWKYSPTILNGEPMPVLARILVTFRIQ